MIRQSGSRRAALWLIAMLVLSTALRTLLATEVKSPFIFLDELVYPRLAQSIGDHGNLSLFGQSGLSYPPLYPVVLSPIYALHASGTTAYFWIRVVNSFLMSLAVFPIYAIARYAVPRRHALIVAGLASIAPLMYYTTLAMSESLTYPLFLFSVWAMLSAIRTPSLRRDAVLLVSIGAASAARLQMVALFPAALTAIVLAGVLADREAHGFIRAAVTRLGRHRLLIAATAAAIVTAAATKLTGHSLFSATGNYSGAGLGNLQNPLTVAHLALEHLAELSLALGVAPFAGTVFAAYVLFRHGSRRPDGNAFAAVALAVTFWLLVEVADAAAVISDSSELPRIHERYLFYLIPLFLTAFVAAARLPAKSVRVSAGAVIVAAILPAVIPFHTVVNNTIVADTFGLDIFARKTSHGLVALHNPVVAAVIVGAAFGSLFVFVRNALPGLVVGVVVFFLLFSLAVRSRIVSPALGASLALSHHEWVDDAHPASGVALLAGPGMKREAALQTAFYNLSVTRLYYDCPLQSATTIGQKITVSNGGTILQSGRPVAAAYAVVSTRFAVRGTVLARDRHAGVELVKTEDGHLRLRPGQLKARTSC